MIYFSQLQEVQTVYSVLFRQFTSVTYDKKMVYFCPHFTQLSIVNQRKVFFVLFIHFTPV